MNASTRLRDRLNEGGWTLKRTGKHETWHHPGGGTFTLGRNICDGSRSFKNYLSQIERAERQAAPETPKPTEPKPMPAKPEPKPAKQVKVVLAWNKWVMDTRLATKLSRQDVAEVLHLKNSSIVAKIETGDRLFSKDELALWMTLFDNPVLPQGLVIPLASETDIAKRAGKARQHTPEPTPAPAPEPQPGVDYTPAAAASHVIDMLPAPAKEEPMAPALPTTRSQAIIEAETLLSSARLTDAEVIQLVHGLKTSAKAVILKSLELEGLL